MHGVLNCVSGIWSIVQCVRIFKSRCDSRQSIHLFWKRIYFYTFNSLILWYIISIDIWFSIRRCTFKSVPLPMTFVSSASFRVPEQSNTALLIEALNDSCAQPFSACISIVCETLYIYDIQTMLACIWWLHCIQHLKFRFQLLISWTQKKTRTYDYFLNV